VAFISYERRGWHPQTRAGLFIRALHGEQVEFIPQPVDRWECYASYLLGNSEEYPPPMSLNEELLVCDIEKWKAAEEKLKQEVESDA
jgi:hypothetical protein